MVTDHAATALDNFRFDLPEVHSASVRESSRAASYCLVGASQLPPCVFNCLLPLRVLGLIFEPLRHDKNTKSTLPAGVPNESELNKRVGFGLLGQRPRSQIGAIGSWSRRMS